MTAATAAHGYREVGPLAEGGMALLSAAVAPDGTEVVIKRIRVPFVYDQAYVSLFQDEGAVTEQLDHPNIVRLLDRGEDDLGPYLVFEHVQGTDLGVVLDKRFAEGRPLEQSEALAIAIPLFKALDAAHRASCGDGQLLCVVHRDVSPGNVLLSETGEVKLADFGVAFSALKTDVTQAGEMKGKFAYMAPEQTRGESVDARADIFAAGIVLYECLAGRRLFDGPTDADIVHAVRSADALPLGEANPRVDPALAELVEKLLAKDPAERPTDAGEVVRALQDIAEELCLDHGLKRHVAQLARSNPRPTLEGPSPEAQLGARRRTQRVLQASTGAPRGSRRGPRAAAVVAILLVAGGLGVAARGIVDKDAAPPRAVQASAVDGVAPTAAAARPPTAAEPTSSTVSAAAKAQPPSVDVAPPEAKAEPDAAKSDAPPKADTPKAESTSPKPAAMRKAGISRKQAEAMRTRKRPVKRRSAAKTPERRVRVAGDAKAGFGRLFLNSEPWAEVSVDGSSLGANTPVMGLRLPAGKHTITLKNPHYGISRTLNVEIPVGGDLRRFVDLSKR